MIIWRSWIIENAKTTTCCIYPLKSRMTLIFKFIYGLESANFHIENALINFPNKLRTIYSVIRPLKIKIIGLAFKSLSNRPRAPKDLRRDDFIDIRQTLYYVMPAFSACNPGLKWCWFYRFDILRAIIGLSSAIYSIIFFKSFSATLDHITSYSLFITIFLSAYFHNCWFIIVN